MRQSSLLGRIERSPPLEDELRGRVRGNFCHACRPPHFTTGNILHSATTITSGKRLHWPGWNVNLAHVVRVFHSPLIITKVFFSEGITLLSPSLGDGDQHVKYWAPHTAERSDLEEDFEWAFDTLLTQNCPGFRVTTNKKEKIVLVWVLDVIHDFADLVEDVDLDNRGRGQVLITSPSSEVPVPGPVYHGTVGDISIDSTGDLTHDEAGYLLDRGLRSHLRHP